MRIKRLFMSMGISLFSLLSVIGFLTPTASANAKKSTATSQSVQKIKNIYYSQVSFGYQPRDTSSSSNLSGSELAAKTFIAMKESSGSYTARNGQYYGRYQLGIGLLHGDLSPQNQETTADQYVLNRYGSWKQAKIFLINNGWY